MSGLAVFSFKSPSLLKFEELLSEETVRANLTSLYGVKKAPCDSQLREVLDPVSPIELRPAFVEIHAPLQRQNMMEAFEFLDGQLLSIDGTGLYSSGKVSCPECCVKGNLSNLGNSSSRIGRNRIHLRDEMLNAWMRVRRTLPTQASRIASAPTANAAIVTQNPLL